MLKLINPNKIRVEFDAFKRYTRLSVEPLDYLELTHPADLTAEGVNYYKKISDVYSLKLEVSESEYPPYTSVEEKIYLGGTQPINESTKDSTTSGAEDESSVDSNSPTESPVKDQVEDKVEETLEDDATESTGVEEEQDESKEDTVESLTDLLKGKGLSELKSLLKKAGIEVSGRVTIASATKALLSNEGKVREVL